MTPSSRLVRFVFATGWCAILVPGCGEGPAGGNVVFAPATGVVTFQGSPVSGARVMAFPEKGPVASALTDSSGNFVLRSGAESGVAVGNVKFSVVVPTDAAAAPAGPVVDPTDPTSLTRAMQAVSEANRPQGPGGGTSGTKSPPASVLPAKYASPETSGVMFEIKSGHDNVLTIDLK